MAVAPVPVAPPDHLIGTSPATRSVHAERLP
jgi:hypothetical protein